MALKTYRDLGGWQKSMDLVVAVYRLSKKLPADEKFGLTSQLRRAAVSIPANIAEGYGRKHRGDYIHHLSIVSRFSGNWTIAEFLKRLQSVVAPSSIVRFSGIAGLSSDESF